MQVYKSKLSELPVTSYDEAVKQARKEYNRLKNKSKRHHYIRSSYFKGEKIFVKLFWYHLGQKNRRDRVRRLRLLTCALDLVKNSKFKPEVSINPNNKSETFYRFEGITANGVKFYVQIKQSKRKYFISVFPAK